MANDEHRQFSANPNLWIQPQDLDIFNELNNGRILTLFDLGRLPFGYRVGLMRVMKQNRWGLTMAGASVRYRRRVRLFEKVKISTTAVGRDERFVYIVQNMCRGDEATSRSTPAGGATRSTSAAASHSSTLLEDRLARSSIPGC